MIRDSLYALDNIGFSFLNSMKGISYDDQESPKGIPYMCAVSCSFIIIISDRSTLKNVFSIPT